ncbi:MAG: hypothetical protein HY303_15995 [Candidatus Wallbacteria bacterium]|nr:hypothetical protein [Candidatus Wallbacteria bacterium]
MTTTENAEAQTAGLSRESAAPPPAAPRPRGPLEASPGWTLGLWSLSLGAALLLLLAGVPAYRGSKSGNWTGSLALGAMAFMGAWWFFIFSMEIAATIHVRRGVRFERAGAPEAAAKQFRIASKLGGRLWSLPEYNLGAVLHRAGDLQGAAVRYRLALRPGRGLLLAGVSRSTPELREAARGNLLLALHQLAAQGSAESGAGAESPAAPQLWDGQLSLLWMLFLAGLALLGVVPGMPAITHWTRGPGYALLALGFSLALAASAKARAHLKLSMRLAEEGSAEAALAQVRTAMRLRDLGAEGHVQIGRVLESSGQFDAARLAYRNALSREPGSQSARRSLSALMARLSSSNADAGLPPVASSPQRAGPHEPSSWSVGLSVAFLACMTGLFAAVLAPDFISRLLLRHWPTVQLALLCATLWFILALLLLASARSLRLNRLALALQQSGDLPGSCQVYAEALGAAGILGGSVARYNLATALEQQGDEAGAVREYRAVLCGLDESDGVSIDAVHNLRELLRRRGAVQAPTPGIPSASLWRVMFAAIGGVTGFLLSERLAAGVPGGLFGATLLYALVHQYLANAATRGAFALMWAGDLAGAREALASAGTRAARAAEAREELKRLEAAASGASGESPSAPGSKLMAAGACEPSTRPLALAMLAAWTAMAALMVLAALAIDSNYRAFAPHQLGLALGFIILGTGACFLAIQARAAASLWRGQSLEQAGNTEGASTEYRRAAELSPGGVVGLTAHHRAGRLLQRDGKTQDAVLHYRQGVRTMPVVGPSAPVLHDLVAALDELAQRTPGQNAGTRLASPATPRALILRLLAGYLGASCLFTGYVVFDALRLVSTGWANGLGGALLGGLVGLCVARRFHERLHLQHSRAFLRSGDARAALEDAAEAVRLRPGSPCAHTAMAEVFESLDEPIAADRERELSLACARGCPRGWK